MIPAEVSRLNTPTAICRPSRLLLLKRLGTKLGPEGSNMARPLFGLTFGAAEPDLAAAVYDMTHFGSGTVSCPYG